MCSKLSRRGSSGLVGLAVVLASLTAAADPGAAPVAPNCPARSAPGCLCVAASRAATLKLPVGPCDCGDGCAPVDEAAFDAAISEAAGRAAAAKVAPPTVTIGVIDVGLFIALIALSLHLAGAI